MAKVVLYKSKKLRDNTHPNLVRWYENQKQKTFAMGPALDLSGMLVNAKVRKIIRFIVNSMQR